MIIFITGASGTIGSALVPFLQGLGHTVHTLRRNGPIKLPKGCDVVINLAGAPIAGRWNARRKKEILESRVQTTKHLVDAMRINPPRLLISASAIGFYGNCCEVAIDEDIRQGSGFLADVCQQWEQEALKAQEFGTRVVLLRLGMVLSVHGGALAKMLPAFRLGLGAELGSGRQWTSWISIQDLLSIIDYCIKTEALEGPVNAVSPQPVTNKEFTEILARAVNRPAIFRAPAWFLRLIFGEFADEALLSSAKVFPKKLRNSGFEFRYAALEQAVQSEIIKTIEILKDRKK